ncbi:MAG: alpha/beta fold hydrolase [Acidimicrobiia bacterium]|nr:alpha/beta fold hydrolase [Acidimicrobiia bacterium]
MEALRTPDDRFVNLPGWPYAPQYTTIASGVSGDSTTLRIAHIDEGPRDSAATVLCMHGEPSWSYLYRKMIPVFVAAGHRVVAPDLIGFGRSDKPVERSDYTYERHVAWMSDWLTSNDLSRLTLVCQDWGGLIGLRLVAAFPERFDRVVVANTFLPVGDRPPSDAFMAWRNYSQTVPRECWTLFARRCRRRVGARRQRLRRTYSGELSHHREEHVRHGCHRVYDPHPASANVWQDDEVTDRHSPA